MTFGKFEQYLSLAWNSVIGWIDDLGTSIGISGLSTIMVVFTLISIVLSYTIRPSVGKSDSEVKAYETETISVTNGRRRVTNTTTYRRRIK